MKPMPPNGFPPVHAYTISTNFDESIKFALTHFTAISGSFPAAVWLHPDRIPEDWPAAWPPVFANDKLNRNIIGLELQPLHQDQPAQLQLI